MIFCLIILISQAQQVQQIPKSVIKVQKIETEKLKANSKKLDALFLNLKVDTLEKVDKKCQDNFFRVDTLFIETDTTKKQ